MGFQKGKVTGVVSALESCITGNLTHLGDACMI